MIIVAGSAAGCINASNALNSRLIWPRTPLCACCRVQVRSSLILSPARAWLRATAKNLCITLWRRQEIERAWLETLAARPEQYAPSAERQAIVLQALQEISELLHRLPAGTVRAFMLAHVCQMTDAAVALELGISERMVRKHVARAMLACLKLNAGTPPTRSRQD